MFNAKIAATTLGLAGVLAGGAMVAGASAASAATAQPTQTMMTCKYRATIRTGTLNVRSGPGVRFKALGYLRRNERVTGPCRVIHGWTLIGRDYTYISGRGPSRPGWVHGRYIKRVR